MDRTRLAAGLLVLLVGAGGVAVLAGVGPLGGNSGTDGAFPTVTSTPTTTAGGGDGGSTAAEPPFELVIEEIESCGQTCRDVTGRLVNNQDRQATGITVYTRIYAGQDTEGDVVWEGSQAVGTLGAGEVERDTQRVELGMMEAAAVQQNDGEITIQTIIETDRRTVQFVDHRDVS